MVVIIVDYISCYSLIRGWGFIIDSRKLNIDHSAFFVFIRTLKLTKVTFFILQARGSSMLYGTTIRRRTYLLIK